MEQEEITTEEETYVDEGNVITVKRIFTKEKGGYKKLNGIEKNVRI